ncbi:MAG TPA: hypothetical protein DEQ02_07800 [Ruminococcaceae bacterium]|nr:hypothetical protein [Oscillospiraceae bacterium]
MITDFSMIFHLFFVKNMYNKLAQPYKKTFAKTAYKNISNNENDKNRRQVAQVNTPSVFIALL